MALGTRLKQAQTFLDQSILSVIFHAKRGRFSGRRQLHPGQSSKWKTIVSVLLDVCNANLVRSYTGGRSRTVYNIIQASVELTDFQTVFRLSAGSASNRRDNLRAFLFAFTALEVFVGKFSTQYRTQLDRLTEKGLLIQNSRPSRTITTRGNEHVLSYKFARVSSYLALDNLDNTSMSLYLRIVPQRHRAWQRLRQIYVSNRESPELAE